MRPSGLEWRRRLWLPPAVTYRRASHTWRRRIRSKTIDGKEVVEEELPRASKMCECKLSVCVRRERASRLIIRFKRENESSLSQISGFYWFLFSRSPRSLRSLSSFPRMLDWRFTREKRSRQPPDTKVLIPARAISSHTVVKDSLFLLPTLYRISNHAHNQ